MVRFVLALLVSGILATMAYAQPSKPNPQQQYAVTLYDLGQCHSKLGTLEQVQARVEAGVLFDADGAKARIEAANPEYILDPQTFTLSPKAKPKVEK